MKVSLALHSPKLVCEWSDKNDISPMDVTYGSNRKVWWNGACGHEWLASVKNRVNGAGCPYCSGNRVLEGFNDLAAVRRELVPEWSKRNHKSPTQVNAWSNQKVLWICSACGGEWEARIADRTEGHGCPYCSFEKIQSGINDFATWYPDLAAEWSDADRCLLPDSVSAKARVRVLWKCAKCGHEWMCNTRYRVKGSGCPRCKKEEELRRKRADIRYLRSANMSQVECFCRKKKNEGIYDAVFRASVMYYAKKQGIRCIYMDDEKIGIPLMYYFPDIVAAVEISEKYYDYGRLTVRERVTDSLCMKAGIRLIRIIKPNEAEHNNCICIRRGDGELSVLSETIYEAYHILGYEIDVDIERDYGDIMEYFMAGNE